jgi:hypothetical protein
MDNNQETFTEEIEALVNALLQMTLAQSSSDRGVSPTNNVPGVVSTHPFGNNPNNHIQPMHCTPSTDFSNVHLCCFGFLLAGSGFDSLRPGVISPAFHPKAEYLFGFTQPAIMNANVQSYLGEIRLSHKDSLDFLERMIDIPRSTSSQQ